MIESLAAYKEELQGLKIRRTREIRWYDDKGRRYTDLWLNGGRALFGYRPIEIKKAWENVLAKGLSIPFSGIYAKRFDKIPEILGFPDFKVAFFPSEAEMNAWFVANQLEMKDVGLFRPYSSNNLPDVAVIRVILPNPFTGCEVILHKEGISSPAFSCPASEVVLLVKTCHEIATHQPLFDLNRIPAELNGKFTVSGPYMFFLGSEEAYVNLVNKTFTQGFILPPDIKDPTIFSPFLSENEKRKLLKILGES